MATGTNGIATYNDVAAAYPNVLDSGGNKCATFLELNQLGFYITSENRSYTNNRLVVFSDITGHSGSGEGPVVPPTPVEYYIEDAIQGMVLEFENGMCVKGHLIIASNPDYINNLRGCTIMTQLTNGSTTIGVEGTVPMTQSDTYVIGISNVSNLTYNNTPTTFVVMGVSSSATGANGKVRGGATFNVQKIGE